MDSNKKQTQGKKHTVWYATIAIVIISLLIIAMVLATSNFDFVDFVIKLHGG